MAGLLDCIRDDVLGKPDEMLKISVPSLVYTVQNNLLYYALSHLDAATYMVCYQVEVHAVYYGCMHAFVICF